MFYELDVQGNFVSDLLSTEGVPNWTTTPVPQPIDTPKFTGTRLETGKWVGEWVDLGPIPLTEEQRRAEWKAQRAAQVDAIKVTTQAGNTFDGDEVSQERMDRAINNLTRTGTPSVVWVLADNSVIDATVEELIEASALAGAAQAAIWVAP